MNIRILFEGQKGAGPLFKTISYAKRPIFEGLLAKCPPKGGFGGAGGPSMEELPCSSPASYGHPPGPRAGPSPRAGAGRSLVYRGGAPQDEGRQQRGGGQRALGRRGPLRKEPGSPQARPLHRPPAPPGHPPKNIQ